MKYGKSGYYFQIQMPHSDNWQCLVFVCLLACFLVSLQIVFCFLVGKETHHSNKKSQNLSCPPMK
jgi:hypothetical protein